MRFRARANAGELCLYSSSETAKLENAKKSTGMLFDLLFLVLLVLLRTILAVKNKIANGGARASRSCQRTNAERLVFDSNSTCSATLQRCKRNLIVTELVKDDNVEPIITWFARKMLFLAKNFLLDDHFWIGPKPVSMTKVCQTQAF